MAGDWIKMRVGLTNHPRVLRMAECLLDDADFIEWSALSIGLGGYPAPTDSELRSERHAALRVTRYVTVTALLKFWGYANEHAKGDSISGLWPQDVDEIAGVPGFSRAMEASGWVEFDAGKGGLTMPNFEEHNTSATVRSSSAAERQKRYRERQKGAATITDGDVTRDVTVTHREEKRREEEKTCAPKAVAFDAATGHFQIPELLMTQWRGAYPALSLDVELSKASAWLIANPKNAKSNYGRFLTNWLTKAQDRAPRVAGAGERKSFEGAV